MKKNGIIIAPKLLVQCTLSMKNILQKSYPLWAELKFYTIINKNLLYKKKEMKNKAFRKFLNLFLFGCTVFRKKVFV